MSEILVAMRDAVEHHRAAGHEHPAKITEQWADHVERLEAALENLLDDVPHSDSWQASRDQAAAAIAIAQAPAELVEES